MARRRTGTFCFCTPASIGENPRAASPVTVIGRIVEGIEGCRLVQAGEKLKIEGIQD